MRSLPSLYRAYCSLRAAQANAQSALDKGATEGVTDYLADLVLQIAALAAAFAKADPGQMRRVVLEHERAEAVRRMPGAPRPVAPLSHTTPDFWLLKESACLAKAAATYDQRAKAAHYRQAERYAERRVSTQRTFDRRTAALAQAKDDDTTRQMLTAYLAQIDAELATLPPLPEPRRRRKRLPITVTHDALVLRYQYFPATGAVVRRSTGKLVNTANLSIMVDKQRIPTPLFIARLLGIELRPGEQLRSYHPERGKGAWARGLLYVATPNAGHQPVITQHDPSPEELA